MLKPTEEKVVKPGSFSCRNNHFPETAPYYTHREIELPMIEMRVTHSTEGQLRAFYASFIHLAFQHEEGKDEAEKFARRLIREMNSLCLFLDVMGA